VTFCGLNECEYGKKKKEERRTKNSQKLDSNITLLNNQIANSTNTKFLGLTIDETLSWKCHINQILSRLSSACYALKVITPLMSDDTLKMIHHSYVHSIITYGIIFGGISPHNTDNFKSRKKDNSDHDKIKKWGFLQTVA
jgi:hypothetical protein